MAVVLVCDDDPNFLSALQVALEEMGHQSVLAGTRAEAINLLRERPVDVAILDMIMPGGGTASLTHEIKRLYPDVAVIVCTGKRAVFDSPIMQSGLNVADAKCEKTIGFDRLEALIHSLLPHGS